MDVTSVSLWMPAMRSLHSSRLAKQHWTSSSRRKRSAWRGSMFALHSSQKLSIHIGPRPITPQAPRLVMSDWRHRHSHRGSSGTKLTDVQTLYAPTNAVDYRFFGICSKSSSMKKFLALRCMASSHHCHFCGLSHSDSFIHRFLLRLLCQVFR